MKAKCPYCDNGCPKCVDGYVEVHFATPDQGHYHPLICNACGLTSGGCLHTPDRPMSEVHRNAVCPSCGGEDLRYGTCEEALEL
jgi:hypothetical protein